MHDDNLTEARDRYRLRAWSEARRLFAGADRQTPLGSEDLERWATSAYLTGRDLEFERLLDRAHRARLEEDDPQGAARCSFWLSLTLLFRGEVGPANGWLARAQRLVEGRDCVENGYLLLPVTERHLRGGNGEEARAAATEAVTIGERFGDADLTASARHLEGRAVIQQGHVEAGLGLLDEAMIAVTSGELSPIVTGLIYCSVIDACHQVFALDRAREWTSALTRWCEQQPELVAFTGTCLVHRAEVLQLCGTWGEALDQACRACEGAAGAGDREPPAEGFYRQGEIYRLRGELEAAEQAYRNASRLGAEPHPGLALLWLARGRADAAGAAIRRVLAATGDPLRRAKYLPAGIDIALAAGNLTEARDACAELDDIAGRYATHALRAMAAHGRGAVELAEGRAGAALGALRQAFELWQQVDAPYETALVRLLIAQACRELEDAESADLEFDAARDMLKRLGATPDVARLDAIRARAAKVDRHGLTPRELEVLREVAAGKTNRAIATELCVSERTIDRHVSNILSKLDVPSRTAATACALDRKLI